MSGSAPGVLRGPGFGGSEHHCEQDHLSAAVAGGGRKLGDGHLRGLTVGQAEQFRRELGRGSR